MISPTTPCGEPQHSEWRQSTKMHCRRVLLSRRKPVDAPPEESAGSQEALNNRGMSPLQDHGKDSLHTKFRLHQKAACAK